MPNSFDYAVLRIVPRVEREEFMNAGVVLFCPEQAFLGMRIGLREGRLRAWAPHADFDVIRQRLAGLLAICEGQADAGPIAGLPVRERFHWLVSPKSTTVQVSAIHSGTCTEPEQTLELLFRKLCL